MALLSRFSCIRVTGVQELRGASPSFVDGEAKSPGMSALGQKRTNRPGSRLNDPNPFGRFAACPIELPSTRKTA